MSAPEAPTPEEPKSPREGIFKPLDKDRVMKESREKRWEVRQRTKENLKSLRGEMDGDGFQVSAQLAPKKQALDAAKKNLDQAKADYDKALPNGSADKTALENAQKAYETAKADYDKALAGRSELLKDLETGMDGALGVYDKGDAEALAGLGDAVAKLEEKLATDDVPRSLVIQLALVLELMRQYQAQGLDMSTMKMSERMKKDFTLNNGSRIETPKEQTLINFIGKKFQSLNGDTNAINDLVGDLRVLKRNLRKGLRADVRQNDDKAPNTLSGDKTQANAGIQSDPTLDGKSGLLSTDEAGEVLILDKVLRQLELVDENLLSESAKPIFESYLEKVEKLQKLLEIKGPEAHTTLDEREKQALRDGIKALEAKLTLEYGEKIKAMEVRFNDVHDNFLRLQGLANYLSLPCVVPYASYDKNQFILENYDTFKNRDLALNQVMLEGFDNKAVNAFEAKKEALFKPLLGKGNEKTQSEIAKRYALAAPLVSVIHANDFVLLQRSVDQLKAMVARDEAKDEADAAQRIADSDTWYEQKSDEAVGFYDSIRGVLSGNSTNANKRAALNAILEGLNRDDSLSDAEKNRRRQEIAGALGSLTNDEISAASDDISAASDIASSLTKIEEISGKILLDDDDYSQINTILLNIQEALGSRECQSAQKQRLEKLKSGLSSRVHFDELPNRQQCLITIDKILSKRYILSQNEDE